MVVQAAGYTPHLTVVLGEPAAAAGIRKSLIHSITFQLLHIFLRRTPSDTGNTQHRHQAAPGPCTPAASNPSTVSHDHPAASCRPEGSSWPPSVKGPPHFASLCSHSSSPSAPASFGSGASWTTSPGREPRSGAFFPRTTPPRPHTPPRPRRLHTSAGAPLPNSSLSSYSVNKT